MRITEVLIERVGGGLEATVENAGQAWAERSGLWIRVRDDAGHEGLGEASPLPGYSPDTRESAEAALRRLDFGAVLEDAGDIEEVGRRLHRAIPDTEPAARFAVETAWLDLVGQRQSRPAWALLGARDGRLPLSSVVTSLAPDPALSEARTALANGVGTIKVKIGRAGRFASELELLHMLRHELGTTWALRLDANGALCPSTAHEQLAQLAAHQVELLEEPVAPEHVQRLLPSPVPLALDESLQRSGIWESPWTGQGTYYAAVVLKPMVLGGIAGSARHARAARQRGLTVSISHTFDGPVALAAAAHLALALASRSRASGLARHAGLAAFPSLRISALEPASVVSHPAPGLGLSPP